MPVIGVDAIVLAVMTTRSARPAARLPRTIALLAAVAVVVVGAAWIALAGADDVPPPPLSAPVDPRYPDVGMAPLQDILIGTEDDGTVFLRFSATIVNVGDGALLVAAHRRLPFGDDWRVIQRVEDATGGYSERPTQAALVFGGDAHDHWHVARAEAHQLETLDGRVVGSLVKTGFCFFDNVPYRTTLERFPSEPVHLASDCGKQTDRDLVMGLSVGWGDLYSWYLLDQTIEITDIPDGRYRLRAIADPTDFFAESDETNNDTWTMVDLGTADGVRTVEVIEQGPAG